MVKFKEKNQNPFNKKETIDILKNVIRLCTSIRKEIKKTKKMFSSMSISNQKKINKFIFKNTKKILDEKENKLMRKKLEFDTFKFGIKLNQDKMDIDELIRERKQKDISAEDVDEFREIENIQFREKVKNLIDLNNSKSKISELKNELNFLYFSIEKYWEELGEFFNWLLSISSIIEKITFIDEFNDLCESITFYTKNCINKLKKFS